MTIDTFIAERLDDQIAYFNKAAAREQRRGRMWQNALIGAAAATPLLIGIAEIIESYASVLRVLSLLSSGLAAVATSILATRQYWENGVAYRAREQTLIREKSLYQMRAGIYGDETGIPADRLLVERVEAMIADDVSAWTDRVKDATDRAKPKKKPDDDAPDDAEA